MPFKAVLKEVLSSAVQNTAAGVVREQSSRLLENLGEVVESVAEDTAILGATAVQRTEHAIEDIFDSRSIKQSVLRTIVPKLKSKPPEHTFVISKCAPIGRRTESSDFATAESSLSSQKDNERNAHRQTPTDIDSAVEKLVDAQTDQQTRLLLQTMESDEVIAALRSRLETKTNSEIRKCASPEVASAASELIPLDTSTPSRNDYGTDRLDSQQNKERIKPESAVQPPRTFNTDREKTLPRVPLGEPSLLGDFSGERPHVAFSSRVFLPTPPRLGTLLSGNGPTDVRAPSASFHKSTIDSRRGLSKNIPHKFEDTKMAPNKRFDGFMNEPRRQRLPYREPANVSSVSNNLVRACINEGRPIPPVAVSEGSVRPPQRVADERIYPCPEGILIHPAPVLPPEVLANTPVEMRRSAEKKVKVD